MKRYIKTTLLALSLILLTACSAKKEYIAPKCSTIEQIDRVKDINVTTNEEGGLDHNETVKVFGLIRKLRISEFYYYTETGRQWRLNNGEL